MKLLLGLYFFFYIPFSVDGQPNSPSSPLKYYQLLNETKSLYNSGDYNSVITRASELCNYYSGDGQNWYMLGQSYFMTKKYSEAIMPFKKASELGSYYTSYALYKLARCYGLLGDKQNSLAYLKQAIYSGYSNFLQIPDDTSFALLQNENEFKKILRPYKNQLNRESSWQFDIDYLVKEIKRMHYVYRQKELPSEITADVRNLRANINKLSDELIFVQLQKIVAHLGDGHSLLFPIGMKKGSIKCLPLKLYFFSDGCFIIDSDPANKMLVGKKVIKIGDFTPEKALEKVTPFISRDNLMEIKWTGPSYLVMPAFLKGAGIINSDNSVDMTFEDENGKTETKVIKVKSTETDESDLVYKLFPSKTSTNPIPTYLSKVDDNYWFTTLNKNTIYFQFNQVIEKENEPLIQFIQKLESKINETDTKNLVIDVRLNNGGESTLLFALYRMLIRFESSEHKVYIITGRNTFSACQDFISNCDKLLANPIFVGEPSSSKPNSYGDEGLFMLPYSGIMGSLSVGYHMNGSTSRDERIWIAPQIPILLSSKDYFSNQDPVLKTLEGELR